MRIFLTHCTAVSWCDKLFCMKKRVIAYVHTHWDREWYREFEVFRLRLLRVFDNVLDMLEKGTLPSFYFDGQVAALLDYLKIRPEKEESVRKFISEKKLFIGPFYCLVDEFLTDKKVFEKNLEIGLKISKDFGCNDYIGYLADTFGHSRSVCKAFKKFGIDKCMVWRGCGDFTSEFIFNGINTINLRRGYFMDIFSAPVSIEAKAEFLKKNLDMIAEKSSDTILLPIGADHLGVETDLPEQISAVNNLLDDYQITLGSPFDYFDAVKDNFKFEHSGELRDNSKTFILPGSYSARVNLKQYNVRASFLIETADMVQKYFNAGYDSVVEYAYKLLLKNQAHDGICGCSTDLVHRENITRYEKVIQIAKTVLKEIQFKNSLDSYDFMLKTAEILGTNLSVVEFESLDTCEGEQIISARNGFDDSILYDTQRIPVTEDYTKIFRLLKRNGLEENYPQFTLNIKDNKLYIDDKISVEFVRYIDNGDTYNFGPEKDDKGEFADLENLSFMKEACRDEWLLKTDFFDVKIFQNHGEEFLRFVITWDNTLKNRLWQVKFNLPAPVEKTLSEDMDELIERTFDSDYKIREHLPQQRGIEAKTNTAAMQRFVSAQGFSVMTKGLTEYEVIENSLCITLLRSVGVISNPENSSRSTPAGPPIEVPEAQITGEFSAEFAAGFFQAANYRKYVNQYFLNEIL